MRDELWPLDADTLLAMSILDVPAARRIGLPFLLRRSPGGPDTATAVPASFRGRA